MPTPTRSTGYLHPRLDPILAGVDQASLTGPAKDSLTELQGFERAVATVSAGCEGEHVQPVVDVVDTDTYGPPQA